MEDRTKLGDGPNESIPTDWLPAIVRIMWRENRGAVGAAIGEVVTGTRYRARRASSSSSGDDDDA